MLFLKSLILRSSAVLLPVFAPLLLAACTSLNSNSTKPGASVFSFASTPTAWTSTNAKYSQLAEGPLAGEIGTSLSAAARRKALVAEFNALESGKAGESVAWHHSESQNGKIIPYPPYQVGSSNCRRYAHVVTINGASKKADGTACRDESGIWSPLT